MGAPEWKRRRGQGGGNLFRLNCAGCHGLAAQGLVGPNLHGVVQRKSDR
ncbi:MAG: c-type cytochrome, partial [Cyanobium sp.]